MQSITDKNFLIRIDTETSKYLEVHSYEIDRISDIIARMISKNFRFDSLGVSSEFDHLMQLCAEYDEAKSKVSDEIVIPKASEKWGKFSNVAWVLNFNTHDITVTFNGNAYQKKYENIAESDDATVETLKSSSIKNLAFIEVFDKLKQQYPTIDTDSYKEFTTAMEENNKLYEDTKNDINSTVINDYLAANDLSADRCQWNLNYTTKKIDLYETVSSAAETE